MPPQSIILHERLAYWSRQVRPRFRGWPIRWSETRSAADLARAATGTACPILLVDLGDRPISGLEALEAGLVAAPTALSLVIDPNSSEEMACAARDLGATMVLGGVVVPPLVMGLLHRWLPLARQRAEAEGWMAPIEPKPDRWGRPDPLGPLGLTLNH